MRATVLSRQLAGEGGMRSASCLWIFHARSPPASLTYVSWPSPAPTRSCFCVLSVSVTVTVMRGLSSSALVVSVGKSDASSRPREAARFSAWLSSSAPPILSLSLASTQRAGGAGGGGPAPRGGGGGARVPP